MSTTFEGLAPSVRPGDRLLLADGLIELRVDGDRRRRDPDDGRRGRRARRAQGHQRAWRAAAGVADHAEGRRRPEVRARRSAWTWSRSASCRRAADLQQARQLMAEARRAGRPADREARAAAGARAPRRDSGVAATRVMVARGDLGLEMPLERVPRAQKDITRRARRARDSGDRRHAGARVDDHGARGRRAPRSTTPPTPSTMASTRSCWRARRPSGAFPARAVQTLDAIIREAETDRRRRTTAAGVRACANDHAQALCEAAVTLANRGDAQAIVAVTRGGGTARRLSALRPRAPIFAATDRGSTWRAG